MNRILRIATWNANGLAQHILELEMFLRNERIDICLISETHYTKQSFSKIYGYCCYHTPHPANKARGGSAVIIRDNIVHHEELSIVSEIMQVTVVSTRMKNRDFKIAAIYCPPKHKPTKEDFTNLLKSLDNHFIVGGDFNAKHTHWGSRIITTKGRELLQAGQGYKCDFLSTGSPTYWPTDPGKLPDLIDFFVVKGLTSKFLHIENKEDLSSDHSPVILTLNENPMQEESLPTLTNKKTNWNNFKEELSQYINLRTHLETIEQVDEEVEQFIADIQQAAEASTNHTYKMYSSNTYYPEEIKELVLAKRQARRRWQRTRFQEDKNKLNRLNNLLRVRILDFKNESISKYLSNLTADKNTEYSLWKATKKLKKPRTHNPPLKQANGKWARNSKQKADLFAEHLADVFTPFPVGTNVDNINIVSNENEEEIPTVTLKELKNLIKCNLSSKKAPGYDLITGQIIKELPDVAICKLQYIINACFKLKYVPRHWKIAEVIVIPKPGKPPNEVTSYRPISLLPTLSKIFEKLLLIRLTPIIRERQLIPPHQFGFRSKHSTIEQVHRITNVIEKALEEKKICAAVFLDVAQAFDKVWHKGLVYKLYRDLPKQYSEILKSYISGRYFRVRHGKDYSALKQIAAGVPQGSVLGPILYLLYTRDIPHDKETLLATFADDTAVLAVNDNMDIATDKLQRALNEINDWTKRWRIKLNETKSNHINFTYRKMKHKPILINKEIVPFANTAKYLGMTLDTKLKWKEHVKKKKEELNIKYRKLYWLIGRNSELSTQNKLLIYKQILKPVWTYGIQLWGCTKMSNIKIIQTFQNKVLRSIVKAPWYIRNQDIHRDLHIDMVEDEVKINAIKHNQRLLVHENTEIEAVLPAAHELRRLKRTKPYELAEIA